jgi:hypothetical protein
MGGNEIYKGFTKEQAEAYEKEAKGKWGNEAVEESKQRVKDMGKAGLEALQQETEAINTGLAAVMHLDIADPAVQALVKRHFEMTGQYFDVTLDIYKGLARMYVADDRFRAYYERYKPGLAEFLGRAMVYYTSNH